jgi:hypothetical protein
VTTQVPKVLTEIVTFVNRLPVEPRDTWKRLRIAVTEAELDELRTYFAQETPDRGFVHAIRAIPIHVEETPFRGIIMMETADGIIMTETVEREV